MNRREVLLSSDRILVEHLPNHPQVYSDDDFGSTTWMVTRIPARWRQVLFAESRETLIVEVRPKRGHSLFPTGTAAPDWALRAIERGQDGSLEREAPKALAEPEKPALALVAGEAKP
jgi:hypothetical protein